MQEYEARVSLVRSRLGGNFVSVEEASEFPGCEYGSSELYEFERSFPDVSVVDACAKLGCALLPGPARRVSLRTLQELLRNELFPDLEVPWYDHQRFAVEEVVRPLWYAVRMVPVPRSVGHPFSAQREMIPVSETLPTVVELLWAVGMLGALRNMYLLPRTLVRTASVGGEGNPITVGVYGEAGVLVSDRYPGEKVFEDVGIISMLRL